jgi:hypothetical protein
MTWRATSARPYPGNQPDMEQYMPPVDPDNEQFVIYVRSKVGRCRLTLG